MDVGLVLKLQHKLSAMEREKMRMQKRLDELDMSPRVERAENAANDAVRISELELTNSNLKSQLMELRSSISDGTEKSKLQEQMVQMQAELDRRGEEVVQLKSVLANQTNNMKSLVNSNTRLGRCHISCSLIYGISIYYNIYLSFLNGLLSQMEFQNQRRRLQASVCDYNMHVTCMNRVLIIFLCFFYYYYYYFA